MKSLLRRTLILLYVTALWMLLVVPHAGAYIDPGSGSFLFQGAIAALMALSLSARTFWRRMRHLFASRDRRP